MSRARSSTTYAYRRQPTPGHFQVEILTNCRSLASLLRQTPEDATPGYWDDSTGTFRPLAGRAVA